jgi:hypothetical protein
MFRWHKQEQVGWLTSSWRTAWMYPTWTWTEMSMTSFMTMLPNKSLGFVKFGNDLSFTYTKSSVLGILGQGLSQSNDQSIAQ